MFIFYSVAFLFPTIFLNKFRGFFTMCSASGGEEDEKSFCRVTASVLLLHTTWILLPCVCNKHYESWFPRDPTPALQDLWQYAWEGKRAHQTAFPDIIQQPPSTTHPPGSQYGVSEYPLVIVVQYNPLRYFVNSIPRPSCRPYTV